MKTQKIKTQKIGNVTVANFEKTNSAQDDLKNTIANADINTDGLVAPKDPAAARFLNKIVRGLDKL